MSVATDMTVRVSEIQNLTPMVKEFTLVPVDSDALPGFSAGSHVVVHIPGQDRVYRNAYSVLSASTDRSQYRIAVRYQENSRGGSAWMHERVKTGDCLQIDPPANLFSLDRRATRHILVAGGIGITPFMSYLHELAALDVPYELHYAYRDLTHAAFHEDLVEQLGNQLYTYDASHAEYLMPAQLLAEQTLGTHLYVCGPEGLIQAVIEYARGLGWPDSHLHTEQFLAPRPGKPFQVNCARRGCDVDVPAEMSLLEALEAAGIPVPNQCRGGVCGQCETGLLDGEAEHCDSFLPDEARARRIMPCVSRARSARLVLDL